MKELSFGIAITRGFDEIFGCGICSLAIKKLPHGEIVSVVLNSSTSDGLLVESKMYDIGERSEIGVLEFSDPPVSQVGFEIFQLPDEFQSRLKVTKLVIAEDDVTADSGILFTGRQGGQIMLVAGVFPHSIAVSAPVIEEGFDPEFPIERYSRIEF